MHQLPRDENFAYNLHFGCIVARWESLTKNYNFVQWPGCVKHTPKPLNFPKKHNLRPQNDPRSLEPKKIITKLPRWRTVLSQWKRWVSIDIHLYYSFPLTKKLSPLHQVHTIDGETFVQSKSW
jgi:hypothetical protein